MKTLMRKKLVLLPVRVLTSGIGLVTLSQGANADLVVSKVTSNLEKSAKDDDFKNAKEETVDLLAQPMAIPRPAKTEIEKLKVKSIHNGKWIAFQLKWSDPEENLAGRLAEFSDAVAMQFPVRQGEGPPPIFMGAKGDPVHILHWRAQYQNDKDKGIKTVKDHYPNMNVDIYPMEFPDMGHLDKVEAKEREVYSYGRAAGNPQSYVKKGVDEILAEGYGTSSVIANVAAEATAKWEKGEWSVILRRPLARQGGSVLDPGKGSHIAFAAWQGSKQEVGSRKSVTMSWIPMTWQ